MTLFNQHIKRSYEAHGGWSALNVPCQMLEGTDSPASVGGRAAN